MHSLLFQSDLEFFQQYNKIVQRVVESSHFDQLRFDTQPCLKCWYQLQFCLILLRNHCLHYHKHPTKNLQCGKRWACWWSICQTLLREQINVKLKSCQLHGQWEKGKGTLKGTLILFKQPLKWEYNYWLNTSRVV